MDELFGELQPIILEKIDGVIEDQLSESGKAIALMQKEAAVIDSGGKKTTIKLHTGRNTNFGMRREDMSQNVRKLPPTGDGQKYDETGIYITNAYLNVTLRNAAISAAKGQGGEAGKNALRDVVASELDLGLGDAFEYLNRVMQRDGSGLLYEILSDVNNAVQTVIGNCAMLDLSANSGSPSATNPAHYMNGIPLNHLDDTSRVQILKLKAGVFTNVTPGSLGYVEVVDISVENNTIEFSAAVDCSDADARYFITIYNNIEVVSNKILSAEFYGFPALYGKGNLKPFGLDIMKQPHIQEIDADANRYWNGIDDRPTSMREFNEYVFMKKIRQAKINGANLRKFLCILPGELLIKVAEILRQNEHKTYEKEIEGGWSVVTYNANGQTIGFVEDDNAPMNTIQGVPFDKTILKTARKNIFNMTNDETGANMVWHNLQILGEDAVQATITGRANTGTRKRKAGFLYGSLNDKLA
ncbi:MAG TPA: hypothetical protein PKY81_15325 [bacterium]|nr:hypothetical protein [bacterium]